MSILKQHTDPSWLETIFSDFNTFLLDHAQCERKASAMAMSMVCHYPDKDQLVLAMTDLAIEELAHFKQVLKHIQMRKLTIPSDTKDPYVQALLKEMRHGKEHYLMDRLLSACIIEARGHERFSMVADALDPKDPAQKMYATIAKAEEKHYQLFLDLAKIYFNGEEVDARLDAMLDKEAAIIRALPHRLALH